MRMQDGEPLTLLTPLTSWEACLTDDGGFQRATGRCRVQPARDPRGARRVRARWTLGPAPRLRSREVGFRAYRSWTTR